MTTQARLFVRYPCPGIRKSILSYADDYNASMPVEHILDEMEVLTDPFAVCELQGKCDLSVGSLAGATLHYVLAGEGEIVFRNRPTVRLQPGTLALIPAFEFHILRSYGAKNNLLAECFPVKLGLEHHTISAAGSNPANKLFVVCSRLHVTLRGSQGLVDLVREPLIENTVPDNAMTAPFMRMIKELSRPQLGSQAMVRTLMLECMIQLLRTRLVARDSTLKWMSALSDDKLWDALRAMLDHPGNPHSVESLADAAGMSRSTFAKHFSDSYGAGPMNLLRNLRMKRAAILLVESNFPVKRISEMVGFHSRSAFNRAFVNCNGKTPQEVRADAREM